MKNIVINGNKPINAKGLRVKDLARNLEVLFGHNVLVRFCNADFESAMEMIPLLRKPVTDYQWNCNDKTVDVWV